MYEQKFVGKNVLAKLLTDKFVGNYLQINSYVIIYGYICR